jgi:hypothetical protein
MNDELLEMVLWYSSVPSCPIPKLSSMSGLAAVAGQRRLGTSSTLQASPVRRSTASSIWPSGIR